jgi:hypothetical protein
MLPGQRAGLLRGRVQSKQVKIRRLERLIAQLRLEILDFEDEIRELDKARAAEKRSA